MSRIDNCQLNIQYRAASRTANTIASVVAEDTTVAACKQLTAINIYATNYNVLRIMSGMGGLAYSN